MSFYPKQDNQTCHERAAVALVASAEPLSTWPESTGLDQQGGSWACEQDDITS